MTIDDLRAEAVRRLAEVQAAEVFGGQGDETSAGFRWIKTIETLRLDYGETTLYQAVFMRAWGLTMDRLASDLDEPNAEIGPRLEELINEAGVGKSELARDIACSRANLYKILRMEIDVPVSKVVKILSRIGCRWSDLDQPAASSVKG